MNEIIKNDCQGILRRVNFSEAKNKRILVTGANGFLGQYLVSALSLANRTMGLGCKIYAVGLSSPRTILKSVLREDKNVTYRRINLARPFRLQGFDYIFHAAGYAQPAKFINDPNSTVAINVDATRNLLAGSKRGTTFVFFSSAEVYGDIPAEKLPVREEYNGNCNLHQPRSVYAESKRLGEALCAIYQQNKGIDAKIVRISHVYGPGLSLSDKRVMSEFIKKALTEKEIKLLDSGKSIKTYGYIADVIAMIFFAAFQGQSMVYNVGGKDSISILELAKKIAKICKAKYKAPLQDLKLSHVGRDPAIVRLNLFKIKKEMKKLKFTGFSEGLLRTIEWSRQPRIP